MGSVKKKIPSAKEEIIGVVHRHLGTKPRRIEVAPDVSFDGEPITRIEIDIEAVETHDAGCLNQIRLALADVFSRHEELESPQLTFRAHAKASTSGGGNIINGGPDVSDLRKMIESLKP